MRSPTELPAHTGCNIISLTVSVVKARRAGVTPRVRGLQASARMWNSDSGPSNPEPEEPCVTDKQRLEQVLRRLRRGERRPPRVRWPVILSASLGLLAAGLFLLSRSDGGPVALTPHSPAEMACQRAEFARELYQGMTPLQRSALDRLEPVVIPTSGFTGAQRERAWRLAAVRGAQFPFHKVTQVTAVLQRTPQGAGMPDEVRCVVRIEFASKGSSVAYRGVVRPTG